MSNHDGTMTTPVWKILEQLATCPILVARGEAVAGLSGSPDYVGRHRVTDAAPAYARAARWIAHEWTKPRTILPPIRDAHDLLIGQTFHDISTRIGTTWRTIDRAAYGRLPATWRHRLETAAKTRTERAQQRDDTEAWWMGRQADYPVLIDTQTMPIIRERTPTP